MNDLIKRLREEAVISDRPGQFDRLNAIADEFAAEIEALRAEVAEWKRVAAAQAELHDEAEECAERLAEALAGLITWIPSADTYRRLGFDPAAPMQALERAQRALGRGGLREVTS